MSSPPAPVPLGDGDRTPRWPGAVALALAILVPLLAYLPTLRFGFVYDDRPLLVENGAIRAGSDVGRFFRQDLESLALGGDRVTSNYYRPVFLLVASGIHRVVGTDPAGWHAAVILLHALAGALALLVLRDLGAPPWLALAGSALFSLHPVHVDSVAWVSGLQDVLAGLFGLSAWLLWRGWTRRGGAGRLAALLGAVAAAFLSKESTFGLPLLFALEALVPAGFAQGGAPPPEEEAARRGRRWLAVAGVVLVAAAVLAVRLEVLGSLARRHPLAPDGLLLVASLPRVVVEYLRLALFPVGIGFFSPVRPVEQLLSPAVLVPLAMLVLLGTGLALALRRRPALLAPVAWFACWLAPHLSLSSVHPEWIVFDRYLHVAILALPMAFVRPAPPRPAVRAALLAAAAAAGLAITLSLLPRFASEEAFWGDAVRRTPNSSAAWSEWGRLRIDAGDLDVGRAALETALRLDPRSLQVQLRLANLEMRAGRVDAAVDAYRRIVAANPDYPTGWRNLVAALDASGDRPAALEVARRAAARFPGDENVVATLVVVLRNSGLADEALAVARDGRRRIGSGSSRLAQLEAQLLRERGGDAPRR